MKKLLLVGALAIFGAANAQTEKGGWVIGGSSGLAFNNTTSKAKYNGKTSDGPKVSAISFAPSFGYFVMNDLAVGLDLSVVSATAKQDEEKETNTTFSVMPAATYYFKAAPNVRPYLGAGVGYAANNTKDTYNGGSESEDHNGLAWKVKGGAVFLINNIVGVDLGVGYSQFRYKQDYYGSESVKFTDGGFGVNVGFSLFLR